MKPIIWIIEVKQDGYWRPTSFAFHARADARKEQGGLKATKRYQTTRVRPYTPR